MRVIKIHQSDNVAVALKTVSPGESLTVGSERITVFTEIPAGHKLALRDIPQGENIIKYGYPIGQVSAGIKKGEHVHTHNLKTRLAGQTEYTYSPQATPSAKKQPGSFMGFKRANGKVGIRNEILIIPTVGCVNAIGGAVAEKAKTLLRGSVQGVYSFPHPYGCSQLGEDHENTVKALCGLANHPNAGGVLILGLGCENNGTDEMKKYLGDFDGERVKFLVCQEHKDETSAALALVEELINTAQNDVREPVSNSELIVGLKCGGSDGFSGITANPLVGRFSDMLIAEGGSAILTEVPEMFGAETILMNRCKNEAVFNKTVKLINDFKAYFESNHQPVYENPSPGNKDGGITTLEDKSLGCTQKAGGTAVTDVLSYGEPLKEKGLNLLQAPGNDLVASTALAVSGAHMVLFTTGRGTPFGAPVPTVKIASNTPLYEKKKNWIDFNAGGLVEGDLLDATANQLFEYVIELASGSVTTKTEDNGIRDMAIFKNGVTL